MQRARWLFVALVCVVAHASGCDACGADHRVPFGLDAGVSGRESDRPSEDDRASAFEARDGLTFGEGTRSIAVEGAPLSSTLDIRALFAHDLDGDGDRDAIVLLSSEGGVSLAHARRDAARFAEPRVLDATLASDPACSVSEASLSMVSPDYALARVSRSCGTEPEPERSIFIISVEAEPRVRESIVLLPEAGRAPGAITLSFAASDHDGDGHGDMVLDVSIALGGGEPARASIAWLDRPGGLARDTAEPEAALETLAREAADARQADATRVLGIAERALALHRALCRESGAPRLRFGASLGLDCGRSAAAGRATAIATAAAAATGDVFAALSLSTELESDALRVTPADRRMVERAIDALVTTRGVTEWVGPEVGPPLDPGLGVRASTVAFRDDDHLAIHDGTPRVVDLSTGTATALGVTSSSLVRDPSGRFAVVGLRRTCEGVVIDIALGERVVAGVVAGRAHASPLLARLAPPPGARCPMLPSGLERDTGGFVVLGWAPQGVVAVRGREMHLVPLTLDATSAGEPMLLAEDAPAPAPLSGGRSTPGAERYALGTPLGVVVAERGGTARLFRPAGFASSALRTADVAISPNGQKVALVHEGRAVVLTLP